jgi:hypothetical protein
MDRFDFFLNKYIKEYINNEYIDEIIITDENGNDIEKINTFFPNNKKLFLIKNEYRLGPFLNKLKACKLAKNEWIVLIDSDNFANMDYFITAQNYIKNVIKDQKNIILAPSKAKPNFDYSHLSGFIYKNDYFKINSIKENSLIKQHNTNSIVLMNTGNFVINKYLIDNLNINNETHNINQSSSCDVIYFNILLFKQLDLNLHIVNNLEYDHVVHSGSIYIQTSQQFQNFSKIIHNIYNNLK